MPGAVLSQPLLRAAWLVSSMMVNDRAEHVKKKLGLSELRAQAVQEVGDHRLWIFLLETSGKPHVCGIRGHVFRFGTSNSSIKRDLCSNVGSTV